MDIDHVWIMLRVEDDDESVVGAGGTGLGPMIFTDADAAQSTAAVLQRLSNMERSSLRLVAFHRLGVIAEYVRTPDVWDALKNVTPETLAQLQRYVEQHERPSSIGLVAVLANDVYAAFAAVMKPYEIFEVVRFLNAHGPAECYGSPDNVEAWINYGPCERCGNEAPRLGSICASCADDLREDEKATAGDGESAT